MLEKMKRYKDKLVSKFKRNETSDGALNILKVWNEELKQYYNIINLKKVQFRELHGKLKEIKKNNADLHKKFILSLWEQDENWEPKYKNIIEDTYRRIENRNNDIDESEREDAKSLLEEVKTNSINVFESFVKELQNWENENIKISPFRMATLIKILRGDCFLFNTIDEWGPRCIQFDKEYANKEISSQILQYENSHDRKEHILISRRHVDKWASLDKMEDCLKKYKKFISYYFKDIKPYVASETWLNDTKFFKYYEEYLRDQWRNPEDQKTIRNLNLTKGLSIWDIKLLPLTQEWKSYYERRRDFVKDDEHSLSKALLEYEKNKGKEPRELQEWETILDLKKLK